MSDRRQGIVDVTTTIGVALLGRVKANANNSRIHPDPNVRAESFLRSIAYRNAYDDVCDATRRELDRLEATERVHHPRHYKSHPSGVECISVIQHMPLTLGTAVKYVWRRGLKDEDGTEDDQKAIFYLHRHVEWIFGGGPHPNQDDWGHMKAMPLTEMVLEHEPKGTRLREVLTTYLTFGTFSIKAYVDVIQRWETKKP